MNNPIEDTRAYEIAMNNSPRKAPSDQPNPDSPALIRIAVEVLNHLDVVVRENTALADSLVGVSPICQEEDKETSSGSFHEEMCRLLGVIHAKIRAIEVNTRNIQGTFDV